MMPTGSSPIRSSLSAMTRRSPVVWTVELVTWASVRLPIAEDRDVARDARGPPAPVIRDRLRRLVVEGGDENAAGPRPNVRAVREVRLDGVADDLDVGRRADPGGPTERHAARLDVEVHQVERPDADALAALWAPLLGLTVDPSMYASTVSSTTATETVAAMPADPPTETGSR